MLVVWTSDPAKVLKDTIAERLKTEGVKHRVCDVTENLPDYASGDLILAFGNDAKDVLAKHKIVPKGRSIGSLRCKLHAMPNGAQVMVTYAPSISHVDYGLYIDLITDMQLGFRWVKTGSLTPQVGHYEWVQDFSAVQAYVREEFKRTGKPVRLTLDTETLGVDPFALDGYIVTVQLTAKRGTGFAIRFLSREECLAVKGTALWHQLVWFLTSPEVSLRAANYKYDQNWLTVMWDLPQSTNFKFDTTLVGSLLDENRSNSLNVHAKIATDMGGYDDPFNQKYDKARMDLALADDPEGFLVYACGDTDSCYQVADKFQQELVRDEELANFYIKILHPAARAYEIVEHVGWYVDRPYYEHFKEEVEDEIVRLENLAKEIIGGRLIARHTKADGTLNITKAALLKDYMFSPSGLNLTPKMFTPKSTPEDPNPSTSIDHLMMFSDDPQAKDFIQIIDEYGSVKKLYTTYIVGFLKHLRSDGRFHPSYFMYAGANEFGDDEGGTNTGRLSCKDPAAQTIIKRGKWAKKLRTCFISPPGYLTMGADFSQGELRIMACLAGALKMISAYRDGVDLHALTSSTLKGIKWEDFMKMAKDDPDQYEYIRYLGKASNFGLIYGQQAQGFQIYAKMNYGLNITLEESQGYVDTFFNLYPEIAEYQRDQKTFARKHRYVRSPLGRIRHLPLIDSPDRFSASKEGRRAGNAPIQSTLSDMSLWASAIMWQRGLLQKAPMFGMIHDQNLRYIPEDNWEKYVTEMVDIMENLPFHELGWEPQLKFPVDPEIGPNLGAMKKLSRTQNGWEMKK